MNKIKNTHFYVGKYYDLLIGAGCNFAHIARINPDVRISAGTGTDLSLKSNPFN